MLFMSIYLYNYEVHVYLTFKDRSLDDDLTPFQKQEECEALFR